MTDDGRVTTSDRYQVTVGESTFDIEVAEDSEGLSVAVGGGPRLPIFVGASRDDLLRQLILGSRVLTALVEGGEGEYTVVTDGEPYAVRVEDERAARLARASAAHRPTSSVASVTAPMPGLVVAVHVEPGQSVAKGAGLVVLQAMKMENELIAREDGTVKEVLVSPGQTVDQGQKLVTLE
jgi:biotin carboxyl carrier protein